MKLEQKKDWRSAVAETLEVEKLRLIVMNGRDEAETAREQWHDGCNTLAVAPGKVVTYNRNRNASKLLRDNSSSKGRSSDADAAARAACRCR